MYFKCGGAIRPNNEAVASISYRPVYDVSRKIVHYWERWDVTGRIVNYPVATQAITTAELSKIRTQLLRDNVDLVFLEDVTRAPTALKLLASECLVGPFVEDFDIPNSAEDVYATGIAYRVVYSAKRLAAAPGSNLLEFEETIACDPGGREFTYVGGAVNLAERQLAFQAKPWRYVQQGRALGAFAYPFIPPPIWPFARIRPEAPAHQLRSPRVLGKSASLDSEYEITWSYEYEWHGPLRGIPHRRFG